MICSICSIGMIPHNTLHGVFACTRCGLLASDFPVEINRSNVVDEVVRVEGLRLLRETNYHQIFHECASLLEKGASILDVGSGHGWFVEAANRRGFRCHGIEPDAAMARKSIARGLPVTQGFFPDSVTGRYDVITFNDVIEHLTDVHAIPAMIAERLNNRGLVIVSLPLSEGAIFHLSTLAARCGIEGPLARMWQRGLPSPHLSYFSRRTIRSLFERAGFEFVASGDLQSVVTTGLYRRIRADSKVRTRDAIAIYLAALFLRIIIPLFPSDTGYFVFRKSHAPHLETANERRASARNLS